MMVEVECDIIDVNRIMTSSPAKLISVDSDSSQLENNELTPVKSNNCSDKDMSLSLRIDANESLEVKKGSNVSNGLLTISTPDQNNSRLLYNNPAFNFYKNLLHLNSTPKSIQKSTPIRKPRVNFHSIDDIVYGGKTSDDESENCDSGYQSHSVLSNLSNSVSINKEQTAKIKHSNEDTENNSENETEYTDDKITKSSSNSNNNKKIRTTFSDQQKWMLEQYFRRNPYPDPKETEDLSKQLVLPENVIKVWFQNKRSRDKQRKFTKNSTQNNNNNDYATQMNNLQLFTNALAPYVAASNQIISGFY